MGSGPNGTDVILLVRLLRLDSEDSHEVPLWFSSRSESSRIAVLHLRRPRRTKTTWQSGPPVRSGLSTSGIAFEPTAHVRLLILILLILLTKKAIGNEAKGLMGVWRQEQAGSLGGRAPWAPHLRVVLRTPYRPMITSDVSRSRDFSDPFFVLRLSSLG